MASIAIESLSIEFPIYDMNSRLFLKRALARLNVGGRFAENANHRVIVKALDNLDLKIAHGDRIGLMGHNGAGKSTFLRALAGIYEPTQGNINIDGKVFALLDVMLGINPESTGIENIILRGILYGLTRKQINQKLSEIADFTELGDYLSVPIRTYSEGMKLRLAFAVATSIEPEILVIDEVVGAGDATFLAKAQQRLYGLMDRSSIVVLASHSKDIIKKLCDKVLILQNGKIAFFGKIAEGLKAYDTLLSS